MFPGMPLTLGTRFRHHHVCLSIWSLFLLIGLQTSTTSALTSLEASARRSQQQQQQQRHDQRRGWSTTEVPRRRQPVPLDCSEGLLRCRDNLNCRTLLDALDRVCDQSSMSLCRKCLE